MQKVNQILYINLKSQQKKPRNFIVGWISVKNQNFIQHLAKSYLKN